MKLPKILFFSLIFTIGCCVTACSSSYVKNQNQFYANTLFTTVDNNHVIICAAFLTQKTVVIMQANSYCSKYNKKANFIRKSYFTNCSLANPISYFFTCN